MAGSEICVALVSMADVNFRNCSPYRDSPFEIRSPIIEKAIETAALSLGSDRSRGYCLEMICADFLAGANLDNQSPETLLFSMTRFFKFLPGRAAADIS
jgi:hypothetical protein